MASRACGPGRPSRSPQPLGEFGQRGNPQAVGDQFKRQRKAARLTAGAAREYQLTGPGPHRHPGHGGPGQEQRHRLRRNRRAGLAGNSHRLHPPYAFGLDIERDTARRQNPQIRGPPGQLPAGTPDRFQHMLAVVDNQQRPAARHRFSHRVKPRRRLGPPDPHRLNQGGNHLLIAAARHQVHVAGLVRPAGRRLDPRRLDRQRGLPDSPDAGKRHHRIPGQPGRDLAQVRGSPDKGQPPGRQPHRNPGPAGITTTGEAAGRLPHQPTVPPCPEIAKAGRNIPAAAAAPCHHRSHAPAAVQSPAQSRRSAPARTAPGRLAGKPVKGKGHG